MNCIIADDHPLFRQALAQLIAGSDFSSSAGDQREPQVRQAHDVASIHSSIDADGVPDLLLLDLHMPGTSGFSALSWFSGNHPAIPVVMISANTHPDTVRRAIDHGAAAFLSKSEALENITDCLRRVLSGERGLHPNLAIGEKGASLEALDTADAMASLTPQQFRVTSMLVEGLLNKQIAYELNVKEATIKAHMTEIFRKLGVQSRTQAVLAIGRLTAISPEEMLGAPDETTQAVAS
ncbi:MAG: response regulator transcription factor [Congregibacter sp.]